MALLLTEMAIPVFAVEPDISITKVWPLKLRYEEGETAQIQVTVKNNLSGPQDAALNVTITGNLDDRVELPPVTLQLEPKKDCVTTLSWKVPDTAHFGYEASAVITTPSWKGTPVREYFCVGKNGWEVGRYITFFWLGKDTKEQLKDRIMKWRKGYITVAEHFAGSPGGYTAMAPEEGEEEWITCQNGYYESKTNLQYIISEGHKNGIQFTAYTTPWGVGPSTLRTLREHPEFGIYRRDGTLKVGEYDACGMQLRMTATIEELKDIRLNKKKEISGGISTGFLWNGDEILDVGIDAISRAVDMFGFDGIRWDGHPRVGGHEVEGAEPTYGQAYTSKGELFCPTNADLYNKHILEYINTKLRGRYPNLLFGYNHAPRSLQVRDHEEHVEMYKYLAPDAYLLWENLRSACFEVQHPLHKWKDYAHAILEENFKYTRPAGGLLHGGWFGGGTVFNRHTASIMYASGVQWDTWAGCDEMFQFAMRFGVFVWNRKVRLLDEPKNLVTVKSERVWWKEFAQRLDNDTTSYLIVHLINPPLKEYLFPKEDNAPEPIAPFGMSLPAKLEGKNLESVTFLMPGTGGVIQEKLQYAPAEKDASFETPMPIPYWAIVIGKYRTLQGDIK